MRLNLILNKKNNINSLAVNKESYKDIQTTKKGRFKKKSQRDMSYKESVESAKLEAKDIYLHSGNDINLQATHIIAEDEKIAYATNSLNILAQTYKEGELHHTSKSSWGGMIKSEYKYENDHLKIKSSQIIADNMILDAKTINLEASQIKAKTMEITTDILNMISSKESMYENEFSNKGGVLTATIINQGKIEEIVIPSIIEVNDKLIFNKQDITDQLEINNLVKTLSSQGNLTVEQINLVKQIASLQEWYDKTTTLSGMGALIVTVVTTYFTAGAGAGLIEGISNAAIKTATRSVIDSVIIQATTSLANSVITGNKLQLDLETIISSAISAGVLSYVNTSLGTNALTDDMNLSDYVKNATIHGVGQGISSEIRDGEFKDGFATGALISIVSDGALQMRKYVKDNFDYPGKPKYDKDGNFIEGSDYVPDNARSPGVRGDGVKLEGGHPSKAYDNAGELEPNPIVAPLGGEQMGERLIFGRPYREDGLVAYTLATFAGPHDFMSSWNYQNINEVTYLKTDNFFVGTVVSGALIVPSIPFAVAPYIQDYLNSIQNYRYLKKDNELIKEKVINNAKDHK